MIDAIHVAQAEPEASKVIVAESVPEATPEIEKAPQPEASDAKAESTATGEKPETDESGEDTAKKDKRSASGRIAQLYAEKQTARAEAQAAIAEAQRLRAELEQIAKAKKSDDLTFEDQDTLRVREAVKAESFENAKAAAAAARHREKAIEIQTFAAKVEAARERMPDFDTVFTADVPMSEIGETFVASSDKAPEIAYYLGKNRQEAYRIANLPAWQQGVELARIEAKVSAATSVRKVSQAPSPVPQVGASTASKAKDPAEMSMAEYEAWRKKKPA